MPELRRKAHGSPRKPLGDITNVHQPSTTKSVKRPAKRSTDGFQNGVWTTTVSLKFLFGPLGDYTLEVGKDYQPLIEILSNHADWTILFIKDFADNWAPGRKYEARFRPTGPIDAVAQRLFNSTPSLHCCVLVEGKGFLWMNRLPEEGFIRGNWLTDTHASAKILPPLNLCFDLDETLIFNAPPKGNTHPLTHVVEEPPHMLVEDVDPNQKEIQPSDLPFKRPQIQEFLKLVCPYFRNVRLATFSVGARGREIADHLDPYCRTLRKNYRQDELTGQKPVPRAVFAREDLLAMESMLTDDERRLMQPGGVYWLKSLRMLDLPEKGLLQRSVIIDDRVDVWVPANQDNIVRITGPGDVGNIGSAKYINGVDGGEIGQRILLTLVNLELKNTTSMAYIENYNFVTLPTPIRMTPKAKQMPSPTKPNSPYKSPSQFKKQADTPPGSPTPAQLVGKSTGLAPGYHPGHPSMGMASFHKPATTRPPLTPKYHVDDKTLAMKHAELRGSHPHTATHWKPRDAWAPQAGTAVPYWVQGDQFTRLKESYAAWPVEGMAPAVNRRVFPN